MIFEDKTQKQTTLAGRLEFEGTGLHTGRSVKMAIEPAPAGTGYVFIRNGVEIPALIKNVSSTSRNTEITAGGETVHTVEHVLSALYSMGVDNAAITLDAPEPPALDGSALPIALAISETGTTTLDKPVKFLIPDKPFMVGEGGSYVTCILADTFHAIYCLEYSHPMIGQQISRFDGTPGEYLSSIAPARTFGLIEEVESLKKDGLALGGSEENAVVVFQDRLSSELRFPDEFARHKLLDMTGDLALAGCLRPKALFIGMKSGHKLNAEAVRRLLEMC
jgi:UDP-3-O-[3-hydroxymyristoyl] N-acetylglucosamine deacetylase